MMINSYWYLTAVVHISIIVTCDTKAVRESINTRTNIGAMANGRMYTLIKLWRIISDTTTGKSVMSK